MLQALEMLSEDMLIDHPSEVYVILQVGRVRENPVYRVHVDPIGMILDGKLQLMNDLHLQPLPDH